ncbi:2-octaprenyl-6-methoxyphenyl hydroxylase [Photobacterium sanguinicancri]|uniref:2-octaprenyl-6-methoxyphenyl hydroxylase n=1 Tax=Photobacterium sanguinicancri TaxID=875932 RepID=A0AAW7Y7A6_9GAMM|nr:2-octaprenyl-6-methoxyphenyl hydroxylase [Photobacterium sanguinicancri]MDO6544171.1 2-octaprenyl-6-methoxyphenyl hydroxylase [Photobacterium sanguinicancri]
MNVKHFDVVIAGGAMAGASLAMAIDTLSQQGLRVAVVEAVEPQLDSHPGYDSRCIALSLGTAALLDTIGVWPALRQEATAISNIHVSDRGHAGIVRLSAQQQAVDALGYVIELADAGRIFHQHLTECQQVTMYCPNSIVGIERQQDSVTLTLNAGEQIVTQLLVTADGALSGCCEMLGIEREEHDFEQVAVIANVTTSERHQGRAFERFTPYGPVALLPMSDGRSSLVWCIKPEHQQQVMNWSDNEFLTELQQAFGWRLGAMVKTGQRASYPLLLRQAKRITTHRVAVVGNAAQTLHPIAGQGFNLGVRDVMTLAEEVVTAFEQGRDIGGTAMLSCYRQRRQPDRQATITMTAGLVGLFANDSLPLVAGRNLGLMAMSAVDSLKAPLIRRAMGQVER